MLVELNFVDLVILQKLLLFVMNAIFPTNLFIAINQFVQDAVTIVLSVKMKVTIQKLNV
jgi:hypothetical protein